MSKPIAQKGSPYWYYDFVIKGRRFHGSTGLTGKKDAKEFIDRLRQTVLLPRVTRPKITLDEACGLYRDHSEHLPSWSNVRPILDALVAGFPQNVDLCDLTQRDLIAYVAARRHGRANSTINRELNTIAALWHRVAAARYDVGEMPDWKALRLKEPRQTHRTLAPTEEGDLVASVRSDVRSAVEFLLLSGWRRSEVIGLRWADVDMVERTAVTRIKGGDYITRPITRAMIVMLANQPKVGPFIFTYVCARTAPGLRTAGERYPLTKAVLRKVWAAAQRAAKATGSLTAPIRIHDLRHTRATRILRSTGNLAATGAALAHRNIKTTMQYAHVLDEDVRNALEASESLNIPEIKMAQGAKP